jgi:hypothetical protein
MELVNTKTESNHWTGSLLRRSRIMAWICVGFCTLGFLHFHEVVEQELSARNLSLFSKYDPFHHRFNPNPVLPDAPIVDRIGDLLRHEFDWKWTAGRWTPWLTIYSIAALGTLITFLTLLNLRCKWLTFGLIVIGFCLVVIPGTFIDPQANDHFSNLLNIWTSYPQTLSVLPWHSAVVSILRDINLFYPIPVIVICLSAVLSQWFLFQERHQYKTTK